MFAKSARMVTVLAFSVSQLPSASDEAVKDNEKPFTIAFAAPAEDRRISALVYIEEPRELRRKQIEGKLEVQAEARIAAVSARPVTVPANLQPTLTAELRSHSKEALKELESGPLVGHDRTFVLFDAERIPRYIVHTHGWTLVSTRCDFVCSTLEVKDPNQPFHEQMDTAVFTLGDLFQEVPNTQAVVIHRKIAEFLRTLPPPVDGARTPFRKWALEGGKGSSTLGDISREEDKKAQQGEAPNRDEAPRK